VTVETVQDETPTLPEIIKISSTGVIKPVGVKNSRKRTIEVKAKKGILPSDDLSYKYAIATESNMEIRGNMSIVGNIHSNGTITASGAYYLDGSAYAVEANNVDSSTGGESDFGTQYSEIYPTVDFDFYKDLINYKFDDEEKYVGYYENMNGGTFYFDDDETISDIYFIDGNVEISANTILNIDGGAIFATGTITSNGSAVITHTRRTVNIHTGCTECCWDPDNPCYDPLCNNPLALVAKGDITLGGTVDTRGIIQTNSKFTLKGVIIVDPGAVIADDGIFRGGGGDDVLNIVYDESLIGATVPGTGLPFYIKISWQEK